MDAKSITFNFALGYMLIICELLLSALCRVVLSPFMVGNTHSEILWYRICPKNHSKRSRNNCVFMPKTSAVVIPLTIAGFFIPQGANARSVRAAGPTEYFLERRHHFEPPLY